MVDRALGQFRATECPICGAPPLSKWTCQRCTDVVNVHRDAIRNLQSWRALYEAGEVPDTLMAETGVELSLWDVDNLFARRVDLPDRQRQSIELCLYANLLEKTAAEQMGIAPSNPVSVYATIGLTALLLRASLGDLPGYQLTLPDFKEMA